MGIFDSIVGAVFGKAIPEFQVKIAVGMRKLNNGTNHNSVSFQFIGKIGNFYQSPSSIAILLRDGADDMPMLSMIDDFRLNGDLDPRFLLINPLPQADENTGYPEWFDSGISIPIDLLRHPYKGSRTMMCSCFIIDNTTDLTQPESWRPHHFATDNVNIRFDDFGYMDAHKNRDRVKELSIDLCMTMAASDGSLDQSELDIIKGWIYRDCNLLDNAAEKTKEKEKFSTYMKNSYSKVKRGALNYNSIVDEINKICDSSSKHNLIELLLEVIAADQEFSAAEDKLLNKLVKALNIDINTFNTMKNKTILKVESIETVDVSLDSLFGITEKMSKNEKCQHLQKQYMKWLNQTTNKDSKIKARAKEMIENISELRSKYGCD